MLLAHSRPSSELVGSMLGALQCDPLSFDATYGVYGDNTPRTLEGCWEKIQSGAWHPIVVTMDGNPHAIHWLHDASSYLQSSWTGGYIPPWVRAHDEMTRTEKRHQAYYKEALWKATRDAIAELGYLHLFCATLLHNERSHRWVTKNCDYHLVGIHQSFHYHCGEIVPARIYTQYREDVELCIQLTHQRAAAPDPCFPR